MKSKPPRSKPPTSLFVLVAVAVLWTWWLSAELRVLWALAFFGLALGLWKTQVFLVARGHGWEDG